MKKHPFDSVSFIFGVFFLLAGVPLILSDSGFHLFEQNWVFPAFLVVAGLVVLLSSQLSDRKHAEDGDDDDDGLPIR
jgi:hypothetical protein